MNESPYPLRPWLKSHPIDLDAVIEAALKNKDRLREARDRRDFLAERIAGLEPFGDFALPAADALRGTKLWFYVLPAKQRRALEKLDLPWQILGRDQARLYVVLISRDELPASILPVPRVHTGSLPLPALREQLAQTEIEIEEAEVERAELSRSRLVLGLRLDAGAGRRRSPCCGPGDAGRGPDLRPSGMGAGGAGGRVRALAEARGLAIVLEDPASR